MWTIRVTLSLKWLLEIWESDNLGHGNTRINCKKPRSFFNLSPLLLWVTMWLCVPGKTFPYLGVNAFLPRRFYCQSLWDILISINSPNFIPVTPRTPQAITPAFVKASESGAQSLFSQMKEWNFWGSQVKIHGKGLKDNEKIRVCEFCVEACCWKSQQQAWVRWINKSFFLKLVYFYLVQCNNMGILIPYEWQNLWPG